MVLITLDEAKAYLRVDTADEDAMIGGLLSSAGRLCMDVARLTEEQWAVIDSDAEASEDYTAQRLATIRETVKVAMLYALGYLFESMKSMTLETEFSAYLVLMTISMK